MNPSIPHRRLAVIGPGRVGRALTEGLRATGWLVAGPLARGYAAADLRTGGGRLPEAVILCVPDREIAPAARTLRERWPEPSSLPCLGHCSGATGLDALLPFEAFSLHPLTTIGPEGSALAGVPAAVDGTSSVATALARRLACDLGMRPLTVAAGDRAAYHAAASIASNFLVTLEAAAESLAATAGVDRAALLPLVRQTLENYAARGPEALTGPIARGDGDTVARQRAAVADRCPALLPLFDALAQATAELAANARGEASPRSETSPGSPRAVAA